MSIIEMIIITLIAIIGTNTLAWFFIWNTCKKTQEMLEDEIEAGRVVRDVKFFEDDV